MTTDVDPMHAPRKAMAILGAVVLILGLVIGLLGIVAWFQEADRVRVHNQREQHAEMHRAFERSVAEMRLRPPFGVSVQRKNEEPRLDLEVSQPLRAPSLWNPGFFIGLIFVISGVILLALSATQAANHQMASRMSSSQRSSPWHPGTSATEAGLHAAAPVGWPAHDWGLDADCSSSESSSGFSDSGGSCGSDGGGGGGGD